MTYLQSDGERTVSRPSDIIPEEYRRHIEALCQRLVVDAIQHVDPESEFEAAFVEAARKAGVKVLMESWLEAFDKDCEEQERLLLYGDPTAPAAPTGVILWEPKKK